MDKEKPYLRLSLRASESKIVTVDEVGLFLFDLTSLYELARLASDPKYATYRFSRFSLYRGNRPIFDEDKLYVESLRHESPLDLQATAAIGTAINAFSSFATLVASLFNLPLNRKLLKEQLKLAKATNDNNPKAIQEQELKVRKLQRDEEEALNKVRTVRLLTDDDIRSEFGEAADVIRKVENRILRSPISVEKLEIQVINPIQDDLEKERLHEAIINIGKKPKRK
jgi:hypothetical protein